MNSIFANRFSMTTNDNKVTFLNFFLDIPEYDKDGKFVEMKCVQEATIILTDDSYSALRNMMDEAEAKKEETT